MSKGKSKRGDITVVIAGESGVGKTSIHRRMQGLPPDQALLTQSTIGVDFLQFEYMHPVLGTVVVDLVDVAGQDSFAAFRTNWYRNIDAAIVVYDVTRRETFERVYTHWIPELIKHSRQPELPMLLVGNKLDLAEKKRAVFIEDVRDIKERYVFFQVVETSALHWTFKTNPTPIDLFVAHMKQVYQERRRRVAAPHVAILADSSDEEIPMVQEKTGCCVLM
jgi:small GTP-binding protein